MTQPPLERAHIGIIGAGQLGQMIALAGLALGHEFTFLDPSHRPPAARLGRHIQAEFDDQSALERLAVECDVLTFEFENVPVSALEPISRQQTLYPDTRVLRIAQDRLQEKAFLAQLGIPVAPHAAVDSLDDLQAAIAQIGLPALLKTRRLGYDGKGQVVLRHPTDAPAAWDAVQSQPCVLEAFVPFSREVSLIAVRSRVGEQSFYPLGQNRHAQGILHRTDVPTNDPAQPQAEDYARRVLTALDYVGVLAIEFFEVDGQLMANEMAPRVHNSGHWTQNGAATSQFENHVRAILGWPLGSTERTRASVMLNLIGRLPDARPLLALPGTHWHDYGKEPRSGRKLGHLNITSANEADCRAVAARAEALIFGNPGSAV
ncbi:5-(carboxyamino)imidazole ribonucleotide synthase [Halothiobacillus sp. DCM-1]|uniref:5-(carboxyamino)imidazole ribonucleotide synthase n=1 Tax=Halothiobacillus sp. DCM-1 TaxID=3112558 RepID=UPI003249B16A